MTTTAEVVDAICKSLRERPEEWSYNRQRNQMVGNGITLIFSWPFVGVVQQRLGTEELGFWDAVRVRRAVKLWKTAILEALK